jgi:Reverse transcriptase (RNA-dependent DNA polymerase)
VNQAYLKSACRLKRELFIQPKELVLGKTEFLQFLLPLYGLAESGDYWGETITGHHLLELQFEQSPKDLALFFKRVGKKLLGISGAYVDDLLRAAPAEYRQSMKQSLLDRFDCEESLSPPMTFTGLEIDKTRQGFVATMSTYIKRLTCLSTTATFKEYRTLRAKLLLVAHARPDISAFVSMDGSVTEESFEPKHVQRINQHVQYLLSTSDVSLSFPELDAEYLHMVVYADASHANCEDGSSQLNYLLCLSDKTKGYAFWITARANHGVLQGAPWRLKRWPYRQLLMQRLRCVTN